MYKGCGNNNAATHGLSNHPLYKVWYSMKARCYNPNLKQYKDWGGRGIKVCKRWHDFLTFYNDMRSDYSIGLSLDRINNNGDYKPSNCRWATKSEQNLNKSNTPPKELTDALLKKGLTYSQYKTRLHLGWSKNQAIQIRFGHRRKDYPLIK